MLCFMDVLFSLYKVQISDKLNQKAHVPLEKFQCIMNYVNDGSPFLQIMLHNLVVSAVQHVGPISPIGVPLGYDLRTLRAMALD